MAFPVALVRRSHELRLRALRDGSSVRLRRGLLHCLFTAACALIALLAASSEAHADDHHCEGPQECCPKEIADELVSHVEVSVGVVLMGISNISERSGTWDADYYLYEEWSPIAGFTPQTEVVNEVDRRSAQFDTVEIREGRCLRSRRLRSTLRSDFNLRTFPFDEQKLVLQLSDDEYDTKQVTYRAQPYAIGIDDSVTNALSAWNVLGDPAFSRDSRVFKWERGAPAYDYGTFDLKVQRHVTFHLTKYFLPLFVIVFIAYMGLWVDPDDLSSQVAIGVTCLLSAIALQFAEGGTLPEVSYLTLADRVYATSYIALAAAIGESIVVNALARKGKRALALRVDRIGRTAFPVVLLVALAGAVVRAEMSR